MTKTPQSLDDLFNEVEAERAKEPPPAPTPVDELERKNAEWQRLLDEAGPEPEDETDEDDEEA
jgi:hypothetical protein